MANIKRGEFIRCSKCNAIGGKSFTPVHIPVKQADGSEKYEQRVRVDTCTLKKDGDSYSCHPHC